MSVFALRFRLLLAGIAGLSVLGCTGSPVIVDSTSSADYSLGLVAHGGRSGEMTVEIHGQPFAQVVSKQAIASTIPVPPWLGVRHLTTAPLPVTPRDYRVVLIFNPAERGGARDACVARQPSVVAPAGGELRVSAAYCAFDRSVAHLVARGPVRRD